MQQGTAVVTGAARGMGAAFARALIRRGHRVIAVDRDAAGLAALAQQVDGGLEPVPCDLADRDAVEALYTRVAGQQDLKVLVNNAGFGIQGGFADLPLDRQLACLDVNAGAAVRLTHAALPRMTAGGGGAVINVASIGGLRPGGHWVMYGASKQFVIFFTEALAQELNGGNVRLQALCPGFTRTGFHAAADAEDARRWMPASLWMTADDVVERSLKAVQDGGPLVYVPGVRSKLQHALGSTPRLRELLFRVMRKAGL